MIKTTQNMPLVRENVNEVIDCLGLTTRANALNVYQEAYIICSENCFHFLV